MHISLNKVDTQLNIQKHCINLLHLNAIRFSPKYLFPKDIGLFKG